MMFLNSPPVALRVVLIIIGSQRLEKCGTSRVIISNITRFPIFFEEFRLTPSESDDLIASVVKLYHNM